MLYLPFGLWELDSGKGMRGSGAMQVRAFRRTAALLALMLLSACTVKSGAPFPLYSGQAASSDNATATGYLTARGGYSYLTLTRDRDGICLGLLPTRSQYNELVRSNGRFVRVSGRYDPAGCGGDYICHDTCGPAVFTRIDAVQTEDLVNER